MSTTARDPLSAAGHALALRGLTKRYGSFTAVENVSLEGRDITPLPPEKRDFGMVFQGYALFPQLTGAENVAFPLRVRGQTRADRDAKVRAALARK